MRSAAAIAFVIAALAASGAASAQGVGLRAGDAGSWIAPSLGGIGDSSPGFGAGSPRSEGRARSSTLSGFLDWSPSSGPFRLTAGLVSQDTRADAGGLSGMVEPQNTIAPYLGIGYSRVPREGLSFYFDLGVIYQDSAGTCGASMSSSQCARYQSDAAAERYGLERSLDKYGFYPVGRVGISVGF